MSEITHRQATKELCQLSGWSLSNLKLQKLLYLAELHFVGMHNGAEQLISSHFEAWDYGPVIPASYHNLKMFGAQPVGNVFRNVSPIEDHERKDLLRQVYQAYARLSAGQLVSITHWEGGAWASKYAPGANAEITRQDILDEYRKRTGAANAA